MQVAKASADFSSPAFFRKPMSTIQRGLWGAGKTSVNTVKVLELTPNFDLDIFKSALKVLERRHLFSRARVELDRYDNAYLTNYAVAEIPLEVHDIASANWDEGPAIKQQLNFQHDSFNGPLTRISVYRLAKRVVLIINMHHVVCDGLSLTQYSIELLELMNDLLMARTASMLDKPAPEMVDIDALIPADAGIGAIKTKLLSLALALINPFVRIDHQPIDNQNPKLATLSWRINRNQTLAFFDACKQRQLSVNSGLSAVCLLAQYYAQADKNNPLAQTSKLGLPINLRHKLKQNISATVLTPVVSMAVLPLTIEPNEDVWTLAARIQNDLIPASDLNMGLNIMAFLAKLPKKMIDFLITLNAKNLRNLSQNNPRLKQGLLLSNLGCSEYSNNGPIKLNYDYGYIRSDMYDKVAVVNTVNGELSFSYSYSSDAVSNQSMHTMQSLISRYIAELGVGTLALAS